MTTHESRYILALDQGTTSSRAIIFDQQGRVVRARSLEFAQIYPRPGWVEHDPEEIWATQLAVAQEVLSSARVEASSIAAVGIANQRETTVVWERSTGRPIYNAIVWQDRRTAGTCDTLKEQGWESRIREKTGLVVDPYFSGTKLKWILENVRGAAEKAQAGELLFGTVDTFLLWRLTGGVHATDYSNASRTMLFNIHTLDWDDELLAALGIPRQMLPRVCESSYLYGTILPHLLGGEIPVTGIAGDQQAATFGQACYTPGMAKNTYGTGCFLLMNTGNSPVTSSHNLLTTIGWGINGSVTYCLEGSVFSAGATMQYLRDSLGLISTAGETSNIALSVTSTGGVYFVPAFTGLGAPYWDPYARGALLGLTRGSGKAEVVRAALESVAYGTRDVIEAMCADSGTPLFQLRVDGGMVPNSFLMQFQADLLGTPVVRPAVTETTALGAAYLAGLAVGYWSSMQEIEHNWTHDATFSPRMAEEERARLYSGWKKAVSRALAWEEAEGAWSG